MQDFESIFYRFEKQLPQNTYIKCCYNCLYSDYSPFGNEIFGAMLCFKNIKDQYLKVKNKGEFMEIQTMYDEAVQETYLCSEFKQRIAGTGYRG